MCNTPSWPSVWDEWIYNIQTCWRLDNAHIFPVLFRYRAACPKRNVSRVACAAKIIKHSGICIGSCHMYQSRWTGVRSLMDEMLQKMKQNICANDRTGSNSCQWILLSHSCIHGIRAPHQVFGLFFFFLVNWTPQLISYQATTGAVELHNSSEATESWTLLYDLKDASMRVNIYYSMWHYEASGDWTCLSGTSSVKLRSGKSVLPTVHNVNSHFTAITELIVLTVHMHLWMK